MTKQNWRDRMKLRVVGIYGFRRGWSFSSIGRDAGGDWVSGRRADKVMCGLEREVAHLTALQAEYATFEAEVKRREQDFARKIGEQEARAEKAEAANEAAAAILRPETYLAKPSEHDDDEQELLDREAACIGLEMARDAIRAAYAQLKGNV